MAEIYERGAINLFDLPWDSLPDIERLRPYQRKAISEIEGAIRHGKREMLVAMATGTGKTFLTVSQIYRLLEVRAFKRILFLVDRRALAAQAVRELGSFTIPNHAFGLIIADECHRGYTSSETARWREVIQYFDAVRIGLTATPAPHSLTLFKEVVSRYTTDEAIADGWLVDYEPYKISSDVLINGAFLKEGEQVGEIDRETGKETYDELEDERDFPFQEVEKKITVPDTNRKIIGEIAKYAYAHEPVVDGN